MPAFKPIELRQPNAELQKKKIRDDMDQTPLGKCPKELTFSEKELWNHIYEICPWLKQSDRQVVIMLCQSLSDIKKARDCLRGELASDSEGVSKLNSYRMLLKEECDRAYRLMGAIGMTPKARSGMSQKVDGKKNTIENILAGTG